MKPVRVGTDRAALPDRSRGWWARACPWAGRRAGPRAHHDSGKAVPISTTQAMDAGAARLGIGAVRVYQWTLRPFIGSHCRFWPSCSEYAVEALRVHGAARGTVMAAKRILRCNPWHEGGVDPVPRFEGNGIDKNMGH